MATDSQACATVKSSTLMIRIIVVLGLVFEAVPHPGVVVIGEEVAVLAVEEAAGTLIAECDVQAGYMTQPT
ncbi:MAG: hypothetical protein M3347_02220 [Armatimonadota bacterium]|nr:hypothetical protein [Armatimonadota bacterium]